MDTDDAWDLWGIRDPYYGVLADPMFRAAALTTQSKDEFFASGRRDADRAIGLCRQFFGSTYMPARILDFGCGVGRVIIPFASVGAEVVGVDIAPSMIAEAKRNCDALGLRNVSFVRSDDQLSAVCGQFDLVHSSIVLQHIEIARGRTIFDALIRRVAIGGCGYIHVTFAWNAYSENFGCPPALAPLPQTNRPALVKSLFRRFFEKFFQRARRPLEVDQVLDQDPEMQMNFYNLSELMFIIQSFGIKNVQVEFTDHGGALGAYLLFQRL